jgi:hypothetical protein
MSRVRTVVVARLHSGSAATRATAIELPDLVKPVHAGVCARSPRVGGLLATLPPLA